MKIIVCVSLVPDSTTKVKISDSKKSIDENGVSYILNPYDELAVEEALKIKEKNTCFGFKRLNCPRLYLNF